MDRKRGCAKIPSVFSLANILEVDHVSTRLISISTAQFSIALPEIRSLIESSRRRVAATANLELVSLYWNTGRIIAREGWRAGHGNQLISSNAKRVMARQGSIAKPLP
jgi:hypothetical protein